LGQSIDPFAFGLGTCHESAAGGLSLWRAADRGEMRYRDVQVINSGFATGPVEGDLIERGGIAVPVASSPALVFYVRAISLQAGDAQSLTLTGPDGALMAENKIAPLERDKAQYQAFSGKKLTAAAWPAGAYRGTYRVTRNGGVVIEKTYTLDMP